MGLLVLELTHCRKMKEEERKEMMIFDFFKIRFLGFYKAELKSEEILKWVRAFSRYPFCWL